ncbi:MAG: hypothetical protein JWN78_1750 [Bacteroidota bacterium]|nr:hypothetical protein [Bacteroidota bacterium]
MKTHKKKIIVMLLMLVSVMIMSFKAATEDKQPQKFQNLKVLPKNISHDDLIAVMRNYCTALGVKCGQCHAKAAGSDKLDFVSDAVEDKAVARKMIKMANAINKKYFSANAGTIACMTCHNGKLDPGKSSAQAIPKSPADSSKRQ